ncbi:MAG: NAD-dependent histone deacetylase SIR2 [Lasallia pustulata]|uniref:tRNA (guanine(10)-N(2))-methyltransferase n=1 Tax=Lasallia pustulata TaxID=136370 RepID=A0A5M8PC93_9LECA|nr:MAG: NAD-dependent histone deacetylase SIR2 [Lasallia pustulata]
MDYLIRLVQVHESFRKPEIQALAVLANINVEFLVYSERSPYCIVRLRDEAAARALARRSILSQGFYELWGSGINYDELHEDIRWRTSTKWAQYSMCSFKFDVDTYQSKRSEAGKRKLIESFHYLGFNGPIKMQHAEQEFCIFEDYDFRAKEPKQVHLGRWIAGTDRDAVYNYSLKQRNYISTTSMDSELALITANLALAGPDKIFYDPFVGTGSFLIACSHFGAMTLGSDIDGRSVRGKKSRNIVTNFQQYGILDRYMDGFISDLTHSPLRKTRVFHGIICDPPYGVREGLKVLGSRDGSGKEVLFIDGKAAHLQDDYIPPKRPYSFEAMLDDILNFAAISLVDDGRLSLWMPTANDEEVELGVPMHPCLELVSVCVQAFNKWSRRLLTYRRLPSIEADDVMPCGKEHEQARRVTADDLNSFRKRYFQGFKADTEREDATGTKDLDHR